MSEEKKQRRFVREKKIGDGTDEHGDYDLVPLSMVQGGKLKPFKVHKIPMKHIINASSPAPRGWYKDKNEPPTRRPRPCYTEALLTTPYGGYCPVGCSFCYVDNGTRGYRATGLPTVNPDYPYKMAKQLAKIQVCGAAYISSFTEPFQQLESRYHITERLTRTLLDEGLPVFYLSRKLPPEWAVEALLENPYSYMQWSVNTSNNDHYRKMSPGSYTIDEVLNAVHDLSRMGIYTSFQCNPIIAGVTTLDDLKELVRLGAEAGLDHIILKFAEQVFNQRQLLIDRLSAHKLPNMDVFDSLFNQTIGGVYTVQEDVRIAWLDELLDCTRNCGITMSTCYEYYDDGASGTSLAPYYTTADQCHGRGVPVHFRSEPDQPFEPLPGCYRKGCLYCLDYGTQACDNDVLLDAKALAYKDLREIRLKGDDDNWDLPDSCARPGDVGWFGLNPNLDTDAEMWGWED